MIVQNAIHIQAAKMEIVAAPGNVTVRQVGVEFYVMKVCLKKKIIPNLNDFLIKNWCILELNYCEENPQTCENGGKCTSLIKDDGNFKCECPSGYRGKRCQILPPMMMTTTSTVSPVNNTTNVVSEQIDKDEMDTKPNVEDEEDDIDNEA